MKKYVKDIMLVEEVSIMYKPFATVEGIYGQCNQAQFARISGCIQ
jgi:hypothetical protein